MECFEVKKLMKGRLFLTLSNEVLQAIHDHLDHCTRCNSLYRQSLQLTTLVSVASKLTTPDLDVEHYWAVLRKNLIRSIYSPVTPLITAYWQNLARISLALILLFFILVPSLSYLMTEQQSPYTITVYGSIDVIVEKAFTSEGSLDIKTYEFSDPDMTFIILDKGNAKGKP